MSLFDRIYVALKDAVSWGAFDLQRPDGAVAQTVVLIDPATSLPYAASTSTAVQNRTGVVTTYIATDSTTGVAIGDVITSTQILDITGDTPSTVAVVWHNQTQGADILAPNPSVLNLSGTNFLSDDQLRSAPVPVSVSSSAAVPVQNATGGTLLVASNGLTYADVSVASLTSGQAAGTNAVIGVNASRKALAINPPADCILRLSGSAAAGMPLYGGIPNVFVGPECPTNALFISGLSAGQSVTIWEA